MDVCIFCRNQTDDEIRFGKILKLDKITVHQHCMFLSPALIQNGAEHEGLMGFLPRDLLKETRRAAKLTCSFCKKKGASLGCEERKCSKKFHLPCGLKNGTLHQHFGEYHSFCHKHRPKQDQPDNPQNPGDPSSNCVICFEEVKPSDDKLYAPCCRKEACFHRNCIQIVPALIISPGGFTSQVRAQMRWSEPKTTMVFGLQLSDLV
ncbi:PHD finger protein 7-like [Macrosteles quadrilineatus]|uniref:PHD finger protein 7-like n=1 Tax=Macrosteles quadrilineatus TaxID=74068 RepID=UPI0023E15668|nr:PHD finger protein 7-like [Macrosteles quadrilineatus]